MLADRILKQHRWKWILKSIPTRKSLTFRKDITSILTILSAFLNSVILLKISFAESGHQVLLLHQEPIQFSWTNNFYLSTAFYRFFGSYKIGSWHSSFLLNQFFFGITSFIIHNYSDVSPEIFSIHLLQLLPIVMNIQAA